MHRQNVADSAGDKLRALWCACFIPQSRLAQDSAPGRPGALLYLETGSLVTCHRAAYSVLFRTLPAPFQLFLQCVDMFLYMIVDLIALLFA